MRFITTLAVVALSLGTLACERASTPLSPTNSGSATQAQTAVKATAYLFTKIPPQITDLTIAPGADVQAFAFSLDATATKGQALSELAFMINGSVQAGNLSNFRLVYYPQGLTKPGTIIATNDGATWAPGSTPADFLRLRPQSFILQQNFKGVFALIVDVNAGASPYFFWTRLQTANAIVDGVEQELGNPITCDLPIQGDTIHVN